MSSIIYSQGVVLATAVAVSGTLIFFSIFREKNFPVPPTQFSEDSAKLTLRPCISSDGKRKEKRKKRVRFAESVKESKEIIMNKNGVMMMPLPLPANRMALYTGILKSRVQFME